MLGLDQRRLLRVKSGLHSCAATSTIGCTAGVTDKLQYGTAGNYQSHPNNEITRVPATLELGLFSSLDSRMLAILYSLSNTTICQEITQDPGYAELAESCQLDRVTHLMQKPLSSEFWSNKEEMKATFEQMRQAITSINSFSPKEQKKLPLFVCLEHISKVFLLSDNQIGPEKIQNEIQQTGIYSLFERVSGLGQCKPVYYGKLDVHYETREFRVIWDGCNHYSTNMKSAKLFLDQTVQDLTKTVEQELDEYRDFLYFDPISRYEIPSKTRLNDLKSSSLLVSEIVTNLAPEDQQLTIKFTFERNHNIYFLLTFAYGKWYPSVAMQARKRISSLLGLPEHAKLLIKYQKDAVSKFVESQESNLPKVAQHTSSRPHLAKRAQPHSNHSHKVVKQFVKEITASKPLNTYCIEREFDEAVDLFKSIFEKTSQSPGSRFTEVFFDLSAEDHKKIRMRPLSVGHITARITATHVLEEFYRSKCRKTVEPETSAQILIIEYGQESGLDPSEVAMDIKTPYLDSCGYQHYQLKGVVIEIFHEDKGSLFAPLVKVDGKQGAKWFSPVHDAFLTCLTGLNISNFIYERTFDSE